MDFSGSLETTEGRWTLGHCMTDRQVMKPLQVSRSAILSGVTISGSVERKGESRIWSGK